MCGCVCTSLVEKVFCLPSTEPQSTARPLTLRESPRSCRGEGAIIDLGFDPRWLGLGPPGLSRQRQTMHQEKNCDHRQTRTHPCPVSTNHSALVQNPEKPLTRKSGVPPCPFIAQTGPINQARIVSDAASPAADDCHGTVERCSRRPTSPEALPKLVRLPSARLRG